MMFVIVAYLLIALSYGIITKELIYTLVMTTKEKEKRSSLLVPLIFVSGGLFIDSIYFLIANYQRYVIGDYHKYLSFIKEDNLFIIKIILAISGIVMLLTIKRKERDDKK
ncbi:hypothetical protein D3C71_983930 [compost metagenome]